MGPAALHCRVAGSYTSELASAAVAALPYMPPVTSTLPVLSRVAECSSLAVPSAPVALHCPVPGSYSSAVASSPLLLRPPTTSTLPEGSSVAVWL
ncbi:hypothetical protein D7Y15_42720 [Corallococcus sp. AB030]|nr:hypothetical protein D7Y15_42720 [Corallococcus sp. AB030]